MPPTAVLSESSPYILGRVVPRASLHSTQLYSFLTVINYKTKSYLVGCMIILHRQNTVKHRRWLLISDVEWRTWTVYTPPPRVSQMAAMLTHN